MFASPKIDRPIFELHMNRLLNQIVHSLFSASFSQHYLWILFKSLHDAIIWFVFLCYVVVTLWSSVMHSLVHEHICSRSGLSHITLPWARLSMLCTTQIVCTCILVIVCTRILGMELLDKEMQMDLGRHSQWGQLVLEFSFWNDFWLLCDYLNYGIILAF